MNNYLRRYYEEHADFNSTCFAKVTIFGNPGLFTDKRLCMDNVPDNLYAYEISKTDDGLFVQSFSDTVYGTALFGTFVTNKEIVPIDRSVRINQDKERPDMDYMCHEVVFGQDYNEFFTSCVDCE